MTTRQVVVVAMAIFGLAALLPLAVSMAKTQRHRVLLGNIFALAYEHKANRGTWPQDLSFILQRHPDELDFVSSHWGSAYKTFDQVLVLDADNPGAIIHDKIWKMSVDKHGFVNESQEK